ncbi:MAG: sigma-70 family RNA polymerase sigma factor [Oscillospiraceae bacterium]|nr:sigma-70 family RNA polymerase sigma factor [Oscillospiraceae bacterium]
MDRTDWITLFSRLNNKDFAAFETIYRELRLPVYTVARRIVRAEDLAENIAQEIFLRLLDSPPDPSVKNPRAWVFQMTRNLAIDQLRKEGRRETPPIAEEGSEDLSIAERLDLEAAIARLETEQRETLTLHLNCGLSFREIARVTGRSESAAYRRYRAALKSLRKMLDGGAE